MVLTQSEIDDWYKDSCCACCGEESCQGECPDYEEFERKIIQEELETGNFAPIIPCRCVSTSEVAT